MESADASVGAISGWLTTDGGIFAEKTCQRFEECKGDGFSRNELWAIYEKSVVGRFHNTSARSVRGPIGIKSVRGAKRFAGSCNRLYQHRSRIVFRERFFLGGACMLKPLNAFCLVLACQTLRKLQLWS